MANSEDDLELLLGLESIPETPPSSPSLDDLLAHSPTFSDDRGATQTDVKAALSKVFGSDSEDEDLKRKASMEVFREVVKLPPKSSSQHDPHSTYSSRVPITYPRAAGASNHIEIEQHSRLRIRERSVSQSILNNQLLDIRFVPLQSIRIAAMGENIAGSWATIGVVAEKGTPKVSSTGQNFAVWKISSLDSTMVSIFLFGEAFKSHYKEPTGSIITVFNAKVRRDEKRKELSINISASNQLLKLGTSADYSVCKGSRKDGSPCTAVVNRKHGEYCQYHCNAMRQKYKSKRSELSGGNLASGLSFRQKSQASQNTQGFEEVFLSKPEKPVKVMSVKGLRNVLSKADKVTTKFQSQGIRFLASVADEGKENVNPKCSLGMPSARESMANQQDGSKQKLTSLKRKQVVGDQGSLRKRIQPGEPSLFQSERNRKPQFVMPKHNNSSDKLGLIELDLEEQDDIDDDAMAQAVKLFGDGSLLN
ncbi:hypothetical protein KP509_18G032200 [Ceratopteris richardii]|uniref:Protein MCM10 homolog n=1 Tax=Ceratopteris richardii TaxID=49495 RepID=A0A8T2SQ44_CERRI|nr:hypothetical protein KP509_18G032200 [Ceratopteris richardii]